MVLSFHRLYCVSLCPAPFLSLCATVTSRPWTRRHELASCANSCSELPPFATTSLHLQPPHQKCRYFFVDFCYKHHYLSTLSWLGDSPDSWTNFPHLSLKPRKLNHAGVVAEDQQQCQSGLQCLLHLFYALPCLLPTASKTTNQHVQHKTKLNAAHTPRTGAAFGTAFNVLGSCIDLCLGVDANLNPLDKPGSQKKMLLHWETCQLRTKLLLCLQRKRKWFRVGIKSKGAESSAISSGNDNAQIFPLLFQWSGNPAPSVSQRLERASCIQRCFPLWESSRNRCYTVHWFICFSASLALGSSFFRTPASQSQIRLRHHSITWSDRYPLYPIAKVPYFSLTTLRWSS